MAFTDLTTSDSVRSVLGVSAMELKDATLADPIYTTLLVDDLLAVHPQILVDFATAAAAPARTDAQERFVTLTQMFAAYHIARRCLGAVAMFAPQTIKDSRSELTRQPDPYAALRADVLATLNILKVRMRSAYAAVNPDAVVPAAIERLRVLAATPSTNVITG